MNIEVRGLQDLPGAALQILNLAGKQRIFLFYGDMGAGKTTFIKELCAQLGVQDVVSSPTFSIVNEYTTGKLTLYHFDFYRLKQETEALDLGYEDYFYSGNYCFIEWPEKIPNLLPAGYLKINIKDDGTGLRVIQAEQI